MNYTNQLQIDQSSFPFYALSNFICNSHTEDKYQIFLHTANIARQIADGIVNKFERNLVVEMYEALCDVYQGESYGVGYSLRETIEQYLSRCKQAIEQYHVC